MKWWRLSSLMFIVSLTGCSVFNSTFFMPPKPPLTWFAPARPQIVINTGGNDISLVESHAALLPISATEPVSSMLKITHTATELRFDIRQKDIFKAKNSLVIAIPANLQTLTIQGGGNVQTTTLPSSLQRLNLADSGTVLLQGESVGLQQLVLKNIKQARIAGLKSTDLLVSICDSGPVTLKGDVGIRELQVSDSGRVAITWVHSKELLVQLTDTQQVFLAGVAGLLITTVNDQAQLNAKYLRANKAFVRTTQQGLAEVAVLDSLNAYASDQSNIYYYLQPRLLGRYYQDHGSILDRGEQLPPCLAPECAPMPSHLPG